MQIHHFYLSVLVLLALNFSNSARASYQNAQYSSLATSLNQSLNATACDPNLLQIARINSEFAALPRREAPIEDLREMKFQMLHWRMKTSQKILSSLGGETQAIRFVAMLNDLRALRITLASTVLSPLLSHPLVSSDPSARDALFALLSEGGQGMLLDRLIGKTFDKKDVSPFALAMAGPRVTVPIRPLEPSAYPFDVWSKNPEFSHYAYPDSNSRNTIQFRGMTLKSGDFILMNENDMTDADFTSLGQERAYISHFGIVAILEKNGLRFPVGIEMHTNGLRAVPLNRFISPDFAAYVEIYRLRGMSEEWRNKINQIGAEELKNPKGYDFQSQDANRKFLNCVTVGSMFLERSGIEPIEAKTQVRAQIRDDFSKLGLLYDHLLTPTDVSRSPRVDFIGTIDQNLYPLLMARDLTAGKLVQIFNEGTVAFWKAPAMYYLLRFGLDQVERKTALGKLILKFEKMPEENLPNAPAKLLSWIVPFETRYRNMVKEVMPLLIPRILKMNPSLHEVQADPGIQTILDAHTKKLRALFSKAETMQN